MIEKLKKFYQEYQQLPNKFKLTFLIMLVICIWCITANYLGFVYAPGDPYVIRQFDRANHHFPIYCSLIQESSREVLEKVYGQKLPEDLQWFKDSMIMEISAWKLYIINQKELYSKE